MTPRHARVHGARRHGAPLARGLAIAVATVGIGAGTWVLGSGPDTPTVSEDSQELTVPGLSDVSGAFGSGDAPVVTQPPLSVAPVPPEDAAARSAAGARATRKDRARSGASPSGGAPKAASKVPSGEPSTSSSKRP